MTHTYGQLFAQLPTDDVPKELFNKIIIRVERAEISRLRHRVYTYRAFGGIALAGCVGGIIYVADLIAQSDIPRYVSLLSTDGSYVLSSWKELVLSISDSLPIPETIGVLVFIIACLQFLRVSSKYRARLSSFASPRATSYSAA